MIRFDLKCERGCEFDAWFKDNSAFEKVKASGGLGCAHCGSSRVEKALMAPGVSTSRAKSGGSVETPDGAGGQMASLSSPEDPELARRLKHLREYLDKNSNDVGADFPEEARKIHYGEADSRQIHGVATPEEAKELSEEGVAVAPLPPLPRRSD